jgi:hypothetical protein
MMVGVEEVEMRVVVEVRRYGVEVVEITGMVVVEVNGKEEEETVVTRILVVVEMRVSRLKE